MTVLIDTHSLLWFLKGDPRLSVSARVAIENPTNRKYVSVASCWEIAIKAGSGKLTLVEPASVLLAREISANSFDLPGISMAHATAVETLPPHHKDPFDRLLVAQAVSEGVPIVSVDSQLDPYGIVRIW